MLALAGGRREQIVDSWRIAAGSGDVLDDRVEGMCLRTSNWRLW
jgi:hypothetical protein